MSYVRAPGMSRFYVPMFPNGLQYLSVTNGSGDWITLDAATEGAHLSGYVFWEDGGTHTISSAGGKIGWLPGASVTFADAGTTLRIGIQDIDTASAGPHGDGTFDVYADLVGGTDTITSTTWLETAMESGTKSVADGDLLTVAFDMSARGGTDSVKIRGSSAANGTIYNLPATVFQSTTPTYSNVQAKPNIKFIADDGTIGTFYGGWVFSVLPANVAFTGGSTPDEYGLIYSFPFPVTVREVWACMDNAGQSPTWDFRIYTDPLGTPSLQSSISMVRNNIIGGNAATTVIFAAIGPVDIAANTAFSFSVFNTHATNNIRLAYFDVNAVADWNLHDGGSGCYGISRTDGSGAFAQVSSGVRRYLMGIGISRLDDGAGGGGSSSFYIGA